MQNIAIREYQSARSLQGGLFSLSGPLFVLLYTVRFLVSDEVFANGIAVLTVTTGNTLLLLQLLRASSDRSIKALVLIFTLLGFVTMLVGRNSLVEVLPQFSAHLGFAWAAAGAPPSKRAIYVTLASAYGFFYISMLIGVDPGDIFTISRNFISIVLIMVICLYLLYCQKTSRNPSLFIILASLPLFLWSGGRSGIASGVLIVVGILLLRGFRFIPVVAGAATYFFMFVLPEIRLGTTGLLMSGIARFKARLGTIDYRSLINEEYLSKAFSSWDNFILGVPLDAVLYIVRVDGNPHNSYISLHVGFGLFGLIAFALAIAISTIRLVHHRAFLMLLALVTSMFRSAFDSAAFHGPLDLVIFTAIFYSLNRKDQAVKGQ